MVEIIEEEVPHMGTVSVGARPEIVGAEQRKAMLRAGSLTAEEIADYEARNGVGARPPPPPPPPPRKPKKVYKVRTLAIDEFIIEFGHTEMQPVFIKDGEVATVSSREAADALLKELNREV